MNPIEERVCMLLSNPLSELGYDLVEAKLGKNKEGTTLSVVVDRVEPISMNDIVKVSEKISALLDEEDQIEGAYVLDVSSLGAEKPIPLDKLGLYEGRYVNLHLKNPHKGENYLEGTLKKVEEKTLDLEIKEKNLRKTVTLDRDNVDKARLAIEF